MAQKLTLRYKHLKSKQILFVLFRTRTTINGDGQSLESGNYKLGLAFNNAVSSLEPTSSYALPI